MSTISAQVSVFYGPFLHLLVFYFLYIIYYTNTGNLDHIEVVPFQNDVNLTTAFEGEDIPSFGVFTDHQVDLTLDQSPWHLLDFDQAV